MDSQLRWVASLRADIHNAAGKSFEHYFVEEDFLPGAVDVSIEAKAKKLMEQGVPPAAAVAMASSKKTRDQNLHILNSTLRTAAEKKSKGKGSRSRKAG